MNRFVSASRGRHVKRANNADRGAVMVEFAFVLPFLILLIVGIWELGKYLQQINWIAQGTYSAAMLGSRTPPGGDPPNPGDPPPLERADWIAKVKRRAYRQFTYHNRSRLVLQAADDFNDFQDGAVFPREDDYPKAFPVVPQFVRYLEDFGDTDPANDREVGLVQVTSQGYIEAQLPIFMTIDIPVNIEVTAPMLVRFDVDIGTLDQFTNPETLFAIPAGGDCNDVPSHTNCPGGDAGTGCSDTSSPCTMALN